MPILDYDGTTYYEIGKVYDNDGTTNHQIGKVYDNDSTANHLVYSAETVISAINNIGAFTSKGYSSNGANRTTFKQNSDGIYLSSFNDSYGTSRSLAYYNEKIDFTDVQSVSVIAKATTNAKTIVICTGADSYAVFSGVVKQISGDGSGEFKTYTVDTSDITGEYMIGFSTNGSSNCTLQSITLTY